MFLCLTDSQCSDELLTPNPKNKGVSVVFAIFGCAAHFESELRQNGWR